MTGPYTGAGTEPQGTETEPSGGNPAWNEFLDVVPQEFHSKVTPILEKWDKGVNDRFQKVHSEYEPWKPVIGRGVDPETTNFALNLLNSINTDPEMVYNALREYYKFGDTTSQTGNQTGNQTGQGQPEPTDNPYAKEMTELRQQNEMIAQVLYNQQQQTIAAQADQALDQELSSLKTKYGDYNERYVLAMMQNGMTADSAVKSYFEWRDQEVGKYGYKPLIMGSGGNMPSQNVDVKKLNDAGTKNLVVQMLQAAQQQQ